MINNILNSPSEKRITSADLWLIIFACIAYWKGKYIDAVWHNKTFNINHSFAYIHLLKMRYDNSSIIDKMLIDSNISPEDTHLIITMKNRKVYVGVLYNFTADKPLDKTHIPIIPLKSGYRDDKTLKFELKEDYQKIISELCEQDDSKKIEELLTPIVIDKNEILTMAIWRDTLAPKQNTDVYISETKPEKTEKK